MTEIPEIAKGALVRIRKGATYLGGSGKPLHIPEAFAGRICRVRNRLSDGDLELSPLPEGSEPVVYVSPQHVDILLEKNGEERAEGAEDVKAGSEVATTTPSTRIWVNRGEVYVKLSEDGTEHTYETRTKTVGLGGGRWFQSRNGVVVVGEASSALLADQWRLDRTLGDEELLRKVLRLSENRAEADREGLIAARDEVSSYIRQINRIVKKAHDEANRLGLSPYFDDLMEEVGLPRRLNDYEVTVDVVLKGRIRVPIEAGDTEEAKHLAHESDEDDIRSLVLDQLATDDLTVSWEVQGVEEADYL